MRLTGQTAAGFNASQPPLFTTSDGRVDWVDVAKGICILFVVMMHSTLGVEAATGDHSWMGAVVTWAQPFRMPDFFFIAGLFLVKTIDAPWRRYLDRKVVHFFYFYLIWMVIQCVIKCGLLDGTPQVVLPNMLEALYQPYGTLWFIYILPIFFLVTRLTRNVPVWLMLGVGAALEIAPVSTGFLLLDEFASRFVYFYAGYALAGYAFTLADKAALRPVLAAAALLFWAVFNGVMVFNHIDVMGQSYALAQLPFVSLFMGGLGALAVIVTASLIVRTVAGNVFSYMGARSIVVYLAFFLPMAIVREVGLRLGIFPDTGTLALVTTLVALVTPLIGHWIIQKVGFGQFLFERPAWASIDRPKDGHRRSQPVSIAPAE
ncbi:MAG: acyltransferase family protein [Devosiaceae bacterium]